MSDKLERADVVATIIEHALLIKNVGFEVTCKNMMLVAAVSLGEELEKELAEVLLEKYGSRGDRKAKGVA